MARVIRFARLIVPALAILLMIGNVGVVGATGHGPTPTPNPQNQSIELEKAYTLELRQLPSLDLLIKRGEQRADDLAALIARAKAAGRNTASLEQGLTLYRGKLTTARAAWQTAANLIASHTGLSDAGKVTNLDQARSTVKNIKNALEQSYLTMRSAEELATRVYTALRTR